MHVKFSFIFICSVTTGFSIFSNNLFLLIKPDEEKSNKHRDKFTKVFLVRYQASYGDHAQKLLATEEKNDGDENDFENMFKSAESALKRQDGQNNNQ
mgnify:CR=1 FL=1